MRKKCKAKGCRKKSESLGFCPKHYMRWRRYGDPLVVKYDRENPKICKIDGCKRYILAKGYCNAHYYSWNRYGDPLRRQAKRTICLISGCGKPKFADRFCRFHYIRWRARQKKCSVAECSRAIVSKKNKYCRTHLYYAQRFGNPTHPGVLHQKFCSATGCTKPHYAHGKCYWHYRGITPPKTFRKCDIPGCGKLHQAKGFCHQHYLAWNRAGRPKVFSP
ncbi:MAG: hypothetical protein Q8P82_01785 [bacterium]|nr:hypothetical protein [bacterium]